MMISIDHTFYGKQSKLRNEMSKCILYFFADDHVSLCKENSNDLSQLESYHCTSCSEL